MFQNIRIYFSSLDKGRAWRLFAIGVVIAIIPLTVVIALRQQELRQRASETPISYPVTFSFIPSEATIVPSTNQYLDSTIQLDTGANGQNITGFDITLIFNPQILQISSFTPSTDFTQVIKTIDNSAGIFRYSAVNTASSSTGVIPVGHIIFQAKNPGTSPVALIPAGLLPYRPPQVTALGYNGTLNVTVQPANYTVASASTPTPTLSPVPTITSSPTPTSTLIPTATPTSGFPSKSQGNANGDSFVDVLDYNIWRNEFTGVSSTKNADFNNDLKVDLIDYAIWRNNYSTPVTSIPTPTGIPVFTVSPTPIVAFRRVFVTSSLYTGNLGGEIGADAKCQASADSVLLGSRWKAWISGSSSVANRLTHASGPYKLLNNTVIASNWNDLVDQTLSNPINVTESVGVIPQPATSNVWTNTSTSGYIYESDSRRSCNNWTSDSLTQTAPAGLTSISSYQWTTVTNGQRPCNSQLRLYCFEQ